jgi:atypical dual specificity phosphatase
MKISWLEVDKLGAGSLPASADDLRSLVDQGVRAIVTLTEQPLSAVSGVDRDALAELGIVTLHLPILDYKAPSRQQVEALNRFVERMSADGRPVYVHCYAGVGRTGTMLHAYDLLRGMTLSEAKQHIRESRPHSQYINLSGVQQRFLEHLAAELDRYR